MNFLKLNWIKIVIALTALCVPAGISWYVVQGYKGEIKQLKETVSGKDKAIEKKDLKIHNQEVEIKDLDGKLKDFAVIKETLEKIQKTKEATQLTEKLIDENIVSINSKYQTLPKTDANEQARKREITRERVKGMWLSYCIAYPQNLRCKDEK